MTQEEFDRWIVRFSNQGPTQYWNHFYYPNTPDGVKVIALFRTCENFRELGVHTVGFEFMKTEMVAAPSSYIHYFKTQIQIA